MKPVDAPAASSKLGGTLISRVVVLVFEKNGGRCSTGYDYFLYCVGCGPFSSISRFQIAPSRV